jgi:hypothetical protein
MSNLVASSSKEFQSLLERLQGGINKKIDLDLVAIEVKQEIDAIILVVFDLSSRRR